MKFVTLEKKKQVWRIIAPTLQVKARSIPVGDMMPVCCQVPKKKHIAKTKEEEEES